MVLSIPTKEKSLQSIRCCRYYTLLNDKFNIRKNKYQFHKKQKPQLFNVRVIILNEVKF